VVSVFCLHGRLPIRVAHNFCSWTRIVSDRNHGGYSGADAYIRCDGYVIHVVGRSKSSVAFKDFIMGCDCINSFGFTVYRWMTVDGGIIGPFMVLSLTVCGTKSSTVFGTVLFFRAALITS
jgi:hypothetical protein